MRLKQIFRVKKEKRQVTTWENRKKFSTLIYKIIIF